MRIFINKLLFLIFFELYFNGLSCARFYYIVSKNACLMCDKLFCKQRDLQDGIFEQFTSAMNKVKSDEFILKFAKNDRNDHNFTNEFTSIVDNALTKYDQLFSRISDRLAQKRAELLKLSNDTGFYNSFKYIVDFYKPVLGSNIPFIVYIVDNLEEVFYINTTVFIQDSSIPKMFYFGELVGYFCEILYEYMPNKVEIEGYFRSSSSKYARAAFVVFKRVLAHSMSRWIVWNMGEPHSLKTGDELIDKASSFISSLLTDYLNSGRQIDYDFVVQYIDIFVQNFKDSDKRYDINLASSVVIKAESKGLREFTFQCLKDNFKTEFYQDESLQKYKDSPVVVVTDGDGKVKVSIVDGRIFVFIGSVERDKIEQAFSILKKQVLVADGFSKKL